MSHDHEMVKQLQHRWRWDPNGSCKAQPWHGKCCEYDDQGQLIKLDLCKLGLREVPSQVWQCSTLQTLRLSDNKLSTLSAEVGKLSMLQTLDLSNNQLTTLPAEIGNLFSLETLQVANNKGLKPQFREWSIQNQLMYLRTMQETEKEEERFEVKVLLVGGGGVGKTSLLRSLRNEPFQSSSPTHGIEVNSLSVPHPERSKQNIHLNIWDFGWQEADLAAHQFFFTERSVYLLVWNPRLGEEACRLPFWLKTIEGRASSAKILLVGTHSDLPESPSINYESYQKRYPQICGFCTVSNINKNGLEELKTKIANAAVDASFVGQRWPLTWRNAEQRLLGRSEYYIQTATIRNIYTQYKSDNDKIDLENDFETFLCSLHDLGKILYFHEDEILKMFIFLKPNWISKAINQLLANSDVQKAGGILKHEKLPEIWSTDDHGQRYPRELYQVFMRIMQRFDLCYPLEPELPGHLPKKSLIPQLLSTQPQEVLPAIPLVSEGEQMLMEMRYKLSFVPAGLMSKFLVRIHRYGQPQYWREGAYLEYMNQQAQIVLDTEQSEISIKAWGLFPYPVFLELTQTLDELLQAIQGIGIQRKIPCRCPRQHQLPHYHIYEDLKRHWERGVRNITCSQGISGPLVDLLRGIHPDTFSLMRESMREQSQMSEELRQGFARIEQELMFVHYTMLNLHSLSNMCPNIFVLKRVPQHPINFSKDMFRLQLLCQSPNGLHKIEGELGYEVHLDKEWWKKTGPLLRLVVRALKIGLPFVKPVNEIVNLVNIPSFGSDIDILSQFMTDFNIDTADSLSPTQLDGEQQLAGAALLALYDLIKPQPQPWQGLSPVLTQNGTKLWLCEKHRKDFEVRPIQRTIEI